MKCVLPSSMMEGRVGGLHYLPPNLICFKELTRKSRKTYIVNFVIFLGVFPVMPRGRKATIITCIEIEGKEMERMRKDVQVRQKDKDRHTDCSLSWIKLKFRAAQLLMRNLKRTNN